MALLAGTALATPLFADDLPVGGQVTHGAVDIATTAPGRMTITQSSGNAIVSWQDFSIGEAASVDIRQPGRSSAILNRVTGPMPSSIDGRLGANGQVYLVNPNGVAIGPKGVVSAGAFVASTLAIDDDAFLSGRREFRGGGRSAAVTNRGKIDIVPGGYAALIGGRVDNSGTINVPLGRVGLGAGELVTLDFSGDGFLSVALPSEGEGDDALIKHSGKISADGGSVEIRAATARGAARHAINLSGVVEARSVSGRNGAIVLGGGPGGRVTVSGRLDTSAPVQQVATLDVSPVPPPRPPRGGAIDVTGAEILVEGARIDASGPGGGGTVRIGGDFQGAANLPRAEWTSVGNSTRISADALDEGDGGRIIVWADGLTRFDGDISARGGPKGGDGGFAEVSGKRHLSFAGDVDLRAPAGLPGTLLLDPYDIVITTQPSQNISTFGDVGETLVFPDGTPSILDVSELKSLLEGINVLVRTSSESGVEPGDITLAAALLWSSGTSLTLEADRDILINAPISAGTPEDAASLLLQADNDVRIGADVSVPSGNITIEAGNVVDVAIDAALDAAPDPDSSLEISAAAVDFRGPLTAGNVGITASRGNIVGDGLITAETGLTASLDLDATGDIDVASIGASRSIVTMLAGGAIAFDTLSASESGVSISATDFISFDSLDVSLGQLDMTSGSALGIAGSSLGADDATVSIVAESGPASLGNITAAGGDVSLTTLGNLAFADLQLGVSPLTSIAGMLAATTGTGDIESSGTISGASALDGADGRLSLAAGTAAGTAATISLSSLEWSEGGAILLSAPGDIVYGSFDASADPASEFVVDVDAGGSIAVAGASLLNGQYTFTAGGSFTATEPFIGDEAVIEIVAEGGSVSLGDVSAAGGSMTVAASGDFTFADLNLGLDGLGVDSGSLSATTTSGDIVSTGVISGESNGSAGSLSLVAGTAGTISLNEIEWTEGVTIDLTAPGDISYNAFDAFANSGGSVNVNVDSGGSINTGSTNVFNGTYTFMAAGNFNAAGPLIAGRTALTIGADTITAASDVSAGILDVEAVSGDLIVSGTVSASALGPGSVDLRTGAGSIEVGGLDVFGTVSLDAAGSVSFDTLNVDSGSADISADLDVFMGATQLVSSELGVEASGEIVATGPVVSDFGRVSLIANTISLEAPMNPFSLTLSANGTISSPVPIDVSDFRLESGFWQQLSSTLPAFSAGQFAIGATGDFLRVLGGSGSGIDPYLVSDVFGLQGMRPSDSYALANDIDASGTGNWNAGGGFNPIGTDTEPFAQTFDGRGLTISGLRMDQPIAGLFGETSQATIRNVAIGSASITGETVAGALVGVAGSGTSMNGVAIFGNAVSSGGSAGAIVGQGVGSDIRDAVVASSTVTGAGSVGGAVGELSGGGISRVFVAEDVTVEGVGANSVGGVVGAMQSASLVDVLSEAVVRSTGLSFGPDIGGLVGSNNEGSIRRSAATGVVDVSSGSISATSRNAGGLVGYNDGSIEQSYATGSLRIAGSGDTFSGGLVGMNAGEILQSYSVGSIEVDPGFDGNSVEGGLVAASDGPAPVASFWDTQSSGLAVSAGGIGLTTAQLSDTDGFVALAAPLGWNFQTTWAPPNSYPQLYALAPVIWARTADIVVTYGSSGLPALGQIFGGPDAYSFGPAGDSINTAGIFATSWLQFADVGSYLIEAVGSTTSALGENYTVVSSPGTLTVTPAPLPIVVANQFKTEGEDFSFADVPVSVGTLFADDTIEQILLASAGAAAGAPPGRYPIFIQDLAGTGLSNYEIFPDLGELVVRELFGGNDKGFGGGSGFDIDFGFGLAEGVSADDDVRSIKSSFSNPTDQILNALDSGAPPPEPADDEFGLRSRGGGVGGRSHRNRGGHPDDARHVRGEPRDRHRELPGIGARDRRLPRLPRRGTGQLRGIARHAFAGSAGASARRLGSHSPGKPKDCECTIRRRSGPDHRRDTCRGEYRDPGGRGGNRTSLGRSTGAGPPAGAAGKRRQIGDRRRQRESPHHGRLRRGRTRRPKGGDE